MNKIFGFILITTIGFSSCNNEQASLDNNNNKPTDDVKHEIGKLNGLMKKYEEPAQTFKVSANIPSKVVGKRGTAIEINPNDLLTEGGQLLGKNIEVELKELVNQNQLLNSNAQTVSNGQLLVSGGAYYINLTSDGQQLKLKEGKSLKIAFSKLSENEMSLFYGQRDSLGQMDWQQASEIFKTKPNEPAQPVATKGSKKKKSEMESLLDYIKNDTSEMMTKEEKMKYEKKEKISQKVYDVINAKSFGWINCDRFLDIQNKTGLLVKFDSIDSISFANIYLVFKDINSVMQSYYLASKGKAGNQGFVNIPIGYKVRLLAYTIKDEKVFSYVSDLTVQNNQTLTLSMKETNEDELKKLLSN